MRAQQAQAPIPPLINGFRIIPRGANRIIRLSSADGEASPVGRTLFIVSSDTCRFCLQSVETWQRLLSSLPLGASDQVIVASYVGEAIPEALATLLLKRQVRVKVLEIRRRWEFAQSTGVKATPALLLLDRDSRVRFRTTHVDNESEKALLHAWQTMKSE